MIEQRKLLRQQLELLAKQSKTKTDMDSPSLSNSMSEIYRTLLIEHAFMLSLFVVSAYLFICVKVHIKDLFGRHSR